MHRTHAKTVADQGRVGTTGARSFSARVQGAQSNAMAAATAGGAMDTRWGCCSPELASAAMVGPRER
jgi:hypothetical protein